MREGKDQIVNGTVRLRGLVLDAVIGAMSMWIDEKLDAVSNMLRNEANVAATKVSAAAMCEQKVSAAYFDLVVGELELLDEGAPSSPPPPSGRACARWRAVDCRWPNG